MLLAVPNFSEGRDAQAIAAVTDRFAARPELLDTHSDPVHNRTVLTLAGRAGELAATLGEGAAACVELIDMRAHSGAHPCIGALDVCPVVWLHEADREEARAEALAAATAIAGLDVPVFLYGDLASDPGRRERAFFRNGGPAALRERMAAGELAPDLGPREPHPTAGATLVTARPPLAAFNVVLAGGDALAAALAAATAVREAGGGPSGVRAIAIALGRDRAQVSTNVGDPVAVPLAEVVAAIAAPAECHGARPVEAEVVGLVPEAALAGFPEGLPLPGFDPAGQVIERRLGGAGE